ncbi:phosphatidylinositol 3,4,5-trisphosphate 5-phosphatase 2-like [Halichondria panicea]|uniref:phosphatidylinositol 3,4,5-trisphosphate 5-phosphatase 2-like n=1 Tax=Halichondria panicea TaxID=6063 RepID=UPI00312B5C29
MSSNSSHWVWFHKNVGRVETERILLESKEDGSFLIRESDTIKGAYVLSTIYQKRIHHYRILPNEDGKFSVQAQQGIQRKAFSTLDEMVEYYKLGKRGIVCALTIPIPQRREEEQQEDPDESDDEDDVSKEKNLISKFLLASLSTVDITNVDNSFLEKLKSYLNGDVVKDVDSMSTSFPHVTQLKQLFLSDCAKIHEQLNMVMVRVDLMQSLFDRAGGAKHAGDVSSMARRRRSKPEDGDFDSLGFKLSDCSESIQSLETTAFQMFRELSVTLTGRPSNPNSLTQPPAPSDSGKNSPDQDMDDEEVSFDVKIEHALSGKKNQILTVNLRDCRLCLCKPGERQGTSFEHHQILQLVKSRTREHRLGVQLSGQSRKDYIFNDMRAREHFCQLIQYIRNKMRQEEHDHVSIFVGTWNMGDAGPPAEISSWIRCNGMGKTLSTKLEHAHDMYVFGTQETSVSEKDWFSILKQTLKTLYSIDYEKVTSQTLWGIRCLILVKSEHSNKISHVQVSQVRTGIGNALGNKGGVGISFFFGNISLCFINSHLTSGNEKCTRRNQNYHDILKGMGALKHKNLSQFDLTNQFTHMFFLGDLNYRIDQLSATEIVDYAKKNDHFSIFSDDQLKREMEKKKVFVGFDESPILFPPTYRFAKGARTLDDYVWVKHKRSGIRINVPSYCDRVLWRSYPNAPIINTSYGCTGDIMTSDHSPVFATFQILGIKQYAASVAPTSGLMPTNNKKAMIVIDSVSARIQTNSKTHFYIELHSACFEGLRKSPPNNDWAQVQDSETYVRPVWRARDPAVSIQPIVKEEEYLEQQHLLLIIKSQESDEPYAECCLSLRELIGKSPVSVRRELTHQALPIGELDALIHVTLDQYKQRVTEEELYSDVNFIIQDQGAAGSSSLDFVSNGSKVRQRSHHSESADPPIMNARYRKDSIGTRPMLPVPRSTINSHRPSSASTPSATAEAGAPPLPRRREGAISPRNSTNVPSSMNIPSSNPPIPSRRIESPSTTDPPVPVPRLRPSQSNPPLPTKRKMPPTPTSTPFRQGSSPPLKGRNADPLPPLPSKSPPLPIARQEVPPSPPAHRRQGGRSPRPPSTVDSLLHLNGLQQFSSILIANGYDDMHFLAEVSEEELEEIGVTESSDRGKLLQIFRKAT